MRTLWARIGPPRPELVAYVGREMCRALAYAHDLVGDGCRRRIAGKHIRGIGQPCEPLRVDAVRVKVIALPQGERDGRPQQ